MKKNLSDVERHVENIRIKGYSILKNVLSEEQLPYIRTSLDQSYLEQESEIGADRMKQINELHMLRCPFLYDEAFISLFTNEKLLQIVRAIIGNEVLLHLQNGILNQPNLEHHQSSWHRDLPYQEYTISKPIGISALYCIDSFSEKTGGTLVLPYSHKEEFIPSEGFLEENQVQIIADSGDVLLFDCMVFHKSGYNNSNIIRRGVNNVFVAPLLKQQIDLPRLLKGRYENDSILNGLLGYKYSVSESVKSYRNRKLDKIEKR